MDCDIFISAKTLDADGNPTRDSELAREVHDHFVSSGYRVFLGIRSLENGGHDAYQRAIDDALDAASVLIAVATSAQNLDAKFVRYEWETFLNDILMGVKPRGHIFTYIEGFPIAQLPRALRQRQAFTHGANSLSKLRNFVRNALRESDFSPVKIAVVAAGCTHMNALTSAVQRANSSQRLLEYVLLDDELARAIRLLTCRDIVASKFFNDIEKARASAGGEHPFVIVAADSSVAGRKLSNLFGSHRAAKGLALLTTRDVPDIIISADRIEAYFLYYLARHTLSFLFPSLRNHEDTLACVFDKKIHKADLVQSMTTRALCDECRKRLLAVGGMDAASRIEALDRLFALSGDILKKGPRSVKPPSPSADVTGRRPDLGFEYDPGNGWTLKNIGEGPALDIIVVQRDREQSWHSPVRVPPLGAMERFVLSWLGHANVEILGATFRDVNGVEYTATCKDDLSTTESGNRIGTWPEAAIRRHWDVDGPTTR